MAYPDVLEAYVTGIPADGDGELVVGAVVPARRRNPRRRRAPGTPQGRPLRVQGAQAALGVREVGAPVPHVGQDQEAGARRAARQPGSSGSARRDRARRRPDRRRRRVRWRRRVAARARPACRVVCLEQGDWQDPARYPGAGPDWELQARKQWSSSPERARVGRPTTRSTSTTPTWCSAISTASAAAPCSTARCGPASCRRTSAPAPSTASPTTGPSRTTSSHRTTRRPTGSSGSPGWAATRSTRPAPIRRFRRCRSDAPGSRWRGRHARLGWHWWPEYNAILSTEHDGRHACVQRGSCGSGCNEGAKGSTDVTALAARHRAPAFDW